MNIWRNFPRLAVFGLIFTSSSALAGWSYVASGEAGRAYIDDASISKSGAVYLFWRRVEFNRPTITGTKMQDTLVEINCAKKTMKTLKMMTYDATGRQSDTIDYKFNWHGEIKRGSIDELYYVRVCRGRN